MGCDPNDPKFVAVPGGGFVNTHNWALTRVEFEAVAETSFLNPAEVLGASALGDRMTLRSTFYTVKGKLSDCLAGLSSKVLRTNRKKVDFVEKMLLNAKLLVSTRREVSVLERAVSEQRNVR